MKALRLLFLDATGGVAGCSAREEKESRRQGGNLSTEVPLRVGERPSCDGGRRNITGKCFFSRFEREAVVLVALTQRHGKSAVRTKGGEKKTREREEKTRRFSSSADFHQGGDELSHGPRPGTREPSVVAARRVGVSSSGFARGIECNWKFVFFFPPF